MKKTSRRYIHTMIPITNCNIPFIILNIISLCCPHDFIQILQKQSLGDVSYYCCSLYTFQQIYHVINTVTKIFIHTYFHWQMSTDIHRLVTQIKHDKTRLADDILRLGLTLFGEGKHHMPSHIMLSQYAQHELLDEKKPS